MWWKNYFLAIINGIRTADINTGVRNRRDGEHLLSLMLLFFNSFTACTVLSRQQWWIRPLSVCVCCRSITTPSSDSSAAVSLPVGNQNDGYPPISQLWVSTQVAPAVKALSSNPHPQLEWHEICISSFGGFQRHLSRFFTHSLTLSPLTWELSVTEDVSTMMMMSRPQHVTVDHGCARGKHNLWSEWF